jgi:4-amino-4-deoxy-L-arabinose transferase-like glycosyltransferase
VGTVFFLNIRSTPILEGDGVKYLNVAENIYQGKGIFFGWQNLQPWVGSPPLFSGLIAVVMHFGLSSLDSANIILAFLFSGCLFFVFLITGYNSSKVLGCAALITVVASSMMWHIARTVLVDLLLIFCLLIAIFSLIKYTEKRSIWDLVFCSIFLSLAILTKNSAYLFVVSAILIVFMLNECFKTKFILALIISTISLIPAVIVNIYTSNFVATAVDAALHPVYEKNAFSQFQIALSFVSGPIQYWNLNFLLNNFITICCIIVLFVIVILLKYKYQVPFSSLLIPDNKAKILLTFIIVYFFGLLLILVRAGIPLLERYSSPIFPLIIIYILTVTYKIFILKIKKISTIFVILFSVVLIVFIGVNLNVAIPYAQSNTHGAMITNPEVKSHVNEWSDIACNKDLIIVSNDPWIVQYYCHREVSYLPSLTTSNGLIPNTDDIYQNFLYYQDTRTYIIVFKKIYHNNYGAPYDMYVYYNRINGNITTLIQDYPDVSIYRGHAL